MLALVGDVLQQQLEPFGAGHDLEVSLQTHMHLRAVHHHAGIGLAFDLLQRERITHHVAGQLPPPLGVVGMHTNPVVDREATVAPAEQVRSR